MIDRKALIAEAALAPSVHNVQPARWRLVGDDAIALVEDAATRLRVGDPTGNDAAISLGAAAEGLRLAAGRAGLALVDTDRGDAVAAWRLVAGGAPDALAGQVAARRSWRGAFEAGPGRPDGRGGAGGERCEGRDRSAGTRRSRSTP